MTSLRIAIDLLFERPGDGSSAVDFLRSLVLHLACSFPGDRYLLLGNAGWRASMPDARGLANVDWVEAGSSNEHRLRRILTQQLRFPRLLKQARADVLYAVGNVLPLVGCPCPAVLKISTMHHVHTPELIGWTRVAYRRFMFGAAARRATLVIANSEATAKDIVEHMRVPRNRVRVVYEAVDAVFAACPAPGPHALPARPYILFVSALWPYKEPELLYAAWAAAVQGMDNPPHLVYAGDDPDGLGDRIRRRAGGEGQASRVHFLGRVPNREMPEVYRRALALVYPSRAETFGKPLVEAMQCGTPVVATEVGSIPEVLDGAGRLVPVGDTAALAAALREVISSDALRQTLARRGLDRGKDFTWQAVAARTRAALEEAAAGAVRLNLNPA